MGNGWFKRGLEGLWGAPGKEAAYMVEDIRHAVERSWFGQEVTSGEAEFYRWLGPDAAEGKSDPMGRTAKEPEIEETAPGDVMPPEGRPSNHGERVAMAEAYARHQEAGPFGAIEVENIHSNEWREFEGWLDGDEGRDGGITLEAEERAVEGPEMEM